MPAKAPKTFNLLSVAFFKIFFVMSVFSTFFALQEGLHSFYGPFFFIWHFLFCFLLISPLLVSIFSFGFGELLFASALELTRHSRKVGGIFDRLGAKMGFFDSFSELGTAFNGGPTIWFTRHHGEFGREASPKSFQTSNRDSHIINARWVAGYRDSWA